ncbi:MAG: serine/threonine protein kinase [Nannocystaceae bacterium]|nr:serine/threonine protein kinase [Nannocystaceae bacterium]
MANTHAQTRIEHVPLAGIPLPVERDRSLPLPRSPAATDAREPEVGDRVGRYVLEQRIGEGGMGVVWRAHDVDVGRRVALKFVRSQPSGVDAKLWSRLRREAQALAKLRDGGVVQLFEMGHDALGAYLALEYVPGMHLRRWLRSQARSTGEVLAIIAKAARALAAVHRAGLVHRDVKPTNLLVTPEGRVVWVDFGLALGIAELQRSHTDSIDGAPLRTRLTRANMIVGTTNYMSPEQLLGRDLDGRCDQFALCVTAFEAIFGARPFPQTSAYELALAYESGTPATLPSTPALPRAARRALARGLSIAPQDRFADLEQFADALCPAPRPTRRAFALGAACALAAAGVAAWLSIAATPRASAPAPIAAASAHP